MVMTNGSGQQKGEKVILHYIGKRASKLINISMWKGKKYTIWTDYISANFVLRKKWGFCTKEILPFYIEKYSPKVTLRTVKVAGNTYRIPYELTQQKQSNLFLKSLRSTIRSSSKKNSYLQATIKEITAIWNNRSVLLREKEEIHRKAEGGSAYLQYRW